MPLKLRHLEVVKALLEVGSVSQTAKDPAFTRTFKKRFGKTPTLYRKQIAATSSSE